MKNITVNELKSKIDAHENLHLIDVRKELLSKVYFHKRESKQRYHYFDFRFSNLFADYGFDVVMIFTKSPKEIYDKVHSLYPTKAKYLSIIKKFCFSRHFEPSYERRNLLSHDMTRIAKQFYKLPPKEREFVKEFVNKRIDTIMKNCDFFDEQNFAIKNWFFIVILMTDVYAICRFIRYHMNQIEGSTTVLLAGVYHTYTYSLFLKKWKAKNIFSKNHTLNDTEQLDPNASKCVHVDF